MQPTTSHRRFRKVLKYQPTPNTGKVKKKEPIKTEGSVNQYNHSGELFCSYLIK